MESTSGGKHRRDGLPNWTDGTYPSILTADVLLTQHAATEFRFVALTSFIPHKTSLKAIQMTQKLDICAEAQTAAQLHPLTNITVPAGDLVGDLESHCQDFKIMGTKILLAS